MTQITPNDRDRASRESPVEGPGPLVGHRSPDEERPLKIVAGGSIAEAIAGAAAVVLAILGLSGSMPLYMAAIATLALGVALLAQGGAVASQWSRLARETSAYRGDSRVDLGGGVAAETFGGAAGVVLGILALLDILPTVLLPVALLVFGGTLLLGSRVTVDLSSVADLQGRRLPMTREASLGATGLQSLAGVAGLVLGILSLVGTAPLTLVLVGLLAISAAVLLSGSAATTQVLGSLRR
jgi:hypothetical protein